MNSLIDRPASSSLHGSTSRTADGFTLLEVLLVLGILVVIAAFVVPSLLGRQDDALADATRNNINSFEKIVTNYAINHSGTIPEGDQDDIYELLSSEEDENGKPQNAYLDERPLDGWKRPLLYEYPSDKTKGDKPAIWSNGKDGDEGTADDITNYDEQEVNE